MRKRPLSLDEFFQKTISQHGYMLVNYREVVEPQITSLIGIHGERTALALVNLTDGAVTRSLYATIEAVRDAVFEAEHNPEHEDDYHNAGGFFGHWETYREEDKLDFISKALEVTA